MARLLALEWDSHEARVVIAAQRNSDVVLEYAQSIALAQRDPAAPASEEVGRRLSEALAGRQLGKAETLVAVGRASIELKVLSLPPAPAEELPDLVRFQALREFHSLEPDWPLDFLPLGGAAQGTQSVLAAAIAPELIEQINQACHAAALKPERLVLRPCAAASLLRRQSAGGPQRARLLVDLLADEADLSVMVYEDVAFMRTVRLPSSTTAGEQWPMLLGEIRRTMAAAHNQLGGDRVEAVYLFGNSQEYADLAATIAQTLSLPTHVVDPFANLELVGELRRRLPQHPGRFAPLLGMLLDEASGEGHAIDFLNPRRPAPPKSRRSLVTKIAAAAVAAVVLAALAIWLALASYDRAIERATARAGQLDRRLAELKPATDQMAEIDKWAASDVIWIDELYRLADKLPPASDAVLLQVQCLAAAEGGRMEMEGLVHSTDSIEGLQANLRDEAHGVAGKGSRQDDAGGPYHWRFKSTVDVLTQTEAAKAVSPSPARPAASDAESPDTKPPSATP